MGTKKRKQHIRLRSQSFAIFSALECAPVWIAVNLADDQMYRIIPVYFTIYCFRRFHLLQCRLCMHCISVFFLFFSFFIGADSLKMQLEMHLLNFGILFLVYSAPFSVDSVLFFIFFSAVTAHFHSREESNRKTIKIVSCNRHKHRQLNRNTLRLETLDCLFPLWCNTCNLACSKFHCCNFKNLNWILRYEAKCEVLLNCIMDMCSDAQMLKLSVFDWNLQTKMLFNRKFYYDWV